MKAYISYLFLLLYCLSIYSCTNSSDKVVEQTTFFDLKSYLQEQGKLLQEHHRGEKVTSINGQEESKIVDDIDFSKELSVFANSDINKAAWLDRYQVDSTFDQAGQLNKLSYQALDEKLRTKELVVDFQNGKVNHIAIRNASVNAITESEQRLNYTAGVGYSIESKQKVIGGEEKQLGVRVKVLK